MQVKNLAEAEHRLIVPKLQNKEIYLPFTTLSQHTRARTQNHVVQEDWRNCILERKTMQRDTSERVLRSDRVAGDVTPTREENYRCSRQILSLPPFWGD